MHDDFALELKAARKKAGLTQADCAHLLGHTPSNFSRLENGLRKPTLKEICALSLIYAKSFEGLFGAIFKTIHKELSERLSSLPDSKGSSIERFNRKNTLDRLGAHLSDDSLAQYVA